MSTRQPIVMKLEGFEETSAALKAFGGETDAEMQALIIRTAVRVQSTAVSSIQRGAKTGRVYTRGGVKHRASAPGQPPATDTGALASSVARVDGKLEAAVGTGLTYGRDLEFGTNNMAARPWLFPALESQREYFSEGLKTVLKNAGGKVKKLLMRNVKGIK